MTQKIIDTAKKLQELAERGIGGEKENAKRFLAKYMKEHGLTEAMLNNPDRRPHRFYAMREKEELLCACTWRVMGNAWDGCYRRSTSGRHYLTIECTPGEAAEIEYMLVWYWKAMQKQIAEFKIAFMIKNELYSPDEEESDEPRPELTPEEKERSRRIRSMMLGIKETPHHKALNA